MNLFSDLTQPSGLTTSAGGPPRAALADALFPSAVRHSPFRLWAPGDPVTTEGDRLLIGVATWSAYDMELLDAVAAALPGLGSGLAVEVFNVADCPSPQAFERYVPNLSPVFHTPVVGLWSDGQLVETASGKAGRDLVARVRGLSEGGRQHG